jgi:hypothetical protein
MEVMAGGGNIAGAMRGAVEHQELVSFQYFPRFTILSNLYIYDTRTIFGENMETEAHEKMGLLFLFF